MLAWHTTLTCYGFWLPNDPRGSKSRRVRVAAIREHGEATWVDTNHSVAAVPHDYAVRRQAKESLVRGPVMLSGEQALAVSQGIADYCRLHEIAIWAYAVTTDHVHLLTAVPHLDRTRFVAKLKETATRRLVERGLHPEQDRESRRTPWSRGKWVVFVRTAKHFQSTLAYIERNPQNAGLPPQTWSFVERFGRDRDSASDDALSRTPSGVAASACEKKGDA